MDTVAGRPRPASTKCVDSAQTIWQNDDQMCISAINSTVLASELLRALRSGRSQTALSRRLGYRSNVAYAWESGRRYPAAPEFMRVAQRVGVDVSAALCRFVRAGPELFADHGPATPEGVAVWLRALRGDTTLQMLAARSGLSRYAIARWLRARTMPRLPELLQFVDAASSRGLDFVACFVDPAVLPTAEAAWRELTRRKRVGVELPWSQAVLRMLETRAYRSLARHRPGWIGARLGIDREQEAVCLSTLLEAGMVEFDGVRYRTTAVSVDVSGASREDLQRVRAHWADVGASAIRAGREGVYSWNVFSVSRADLARLQQLHLAYFRNLRAIVAESEPAECVVVANVQLFELGSR